MMNKQKDYMDRSAMAFRGLALWIYDHRWLVLSLSLMFLGVGVYFAAQTRTDNSLESLFDEEDPTYGYYLDYQDDFGSDEIAYILYEAPEKAHGPFNLEVMKKIARLTEKLENEVPFVREVTSLANVEFIRADEDLIETNELLLDFPETQEELLAVRDLVMKKPLYINSLIDEDATHGTIVLEMSLTSSDPLEKIRLDPNGGDGLANLYPQASDASIREILSRPEYEGIKFYLSGDVHMNATYNEVITEETGTLTLATFLVVGIIAMICFRTRLLGLFGPLTVVLLSLCLTMGFMGIMGYPIGILFLMTPTLLTAIGVAQSVHLLSEFQICRSRGMDRREALGKTLELVGIPCLLAAVTTAIGFMSMAVSQLQSISDFAVYGAVGVMIVFAFTITVLLCFLSFGPNNRLPEKAAARTGSVHLARLLEWIIECNLKHRGKILIISAVIFGLSLMGISQLKVAFNFLDEFKDKVQWRQHTLRIEEVMGGILSVVYVFDTNAPDGIKDFDVLKELEALQRKADEHPLVKKTYSIVDILKDINQTFHGDDPSYYRLPESRELISQYLLMYEISGGKELEDYVTGDYARTTLELRVEITDSTRVEDLIRQLGIYLNDRPVTAAQVKLTGIGLLWIKIAEYIASSQMWGYMLAFSTIAILMCLIFRSVKVGLLSMIPNLAPVFFTLGFMGWQGMHLDYFRLLLATIAIGIAVDDTVHLLTRIRMEFYRCGDYTQAIRKGLSTVGQALIITSIVLIGAFLVFLYSQMTVLASFGVLLATTIATALISDLFLMPVLILVFKPFGREIKRGEMKTGIFSKEELAQRAFAD